MAQQMTRHELTGTDKIRVEKTGDKPVLFIGEQQFVLPTDPSALQQVKSGFREAWTQLDQIDPASYSS